MPNEKQSSVVVRADVFRFPASMAVGKNTHWGLESR